MKWDKNRLADMAKAYQMSLAHFDQFASRVKEALEGEIPTLEFGERSEGRADFRLMGTNYSLRHAFQTWGVNKPIVRYALMRNDSKGEFVEAVATEVEVRGNIAWANRHSEDPIDLPAGSVPLFLDLLTGER